MPTPGIQDEVLHHDLRKILRKTNISYPPVSGGKKIQFFGKFFVRPFYDYIYYNLLCCDCSIFVFVNEIF